MTQNQIDCFLSACKTLNFTQTAKELHFTPQGVNKLILSLEEELGVTLFQRNSRTKMLELTPPGQYCMDELARSRSQLSRTMGEIYGYMRQLAGTLRLGISEWVDPCSPDLARALLTFRKEEPDLNFSAVCNDNSTLCDMLYQGTLDVVILSGGQLIPSREFGVLPLARERIALVVPETVCGADWTGDADPNCWGVNYIQSPVQNWERQESIPVIQKELAAMGLFPAVIQMLPNVQSLRAAMTISPCVHITDTRFGFFWRVPRMRYFDVPTVNGEARLCCMWSLRCENPRVTQFVRFMREQLGDYGPPESNSKLPEGIKMPNPGIDFEEKEEE